LALWKTASAAPTTFRIYVPDPVSEQVGFIGVMQEEGKPVQLDHRRVEIADVEMGLVFGLSHFRHSMKQKFVTIKGVAGVEKMDLNINPFDLPAAHICKVRGGQIHEIEAMGFTTAYNSKTGWE
jgi:hypothetical protein